jgi:hypothetical protein
MQPIVLPWNSVFAKDFLSPLLTDAQPAESVCMLSVERLAEMQVFSITQHAPSALQRKIPHSKTLMTSAADLTQ